MQRETAMDNFAKGLPLVTNDEFQSMRKEAVKRIKDIVRSDANRVLNITINNQVFEGTTVRSKLGLRSTDFEIELTENSVNITTRGYGHGVGMSQYGAFGMALEGYNYQEILKHYYDGISIRTLYH